MKKLVSILLALALVTVLFVPMSVSAENEPDLLITEEYEVGWFGHNGTITTTAKEEKSGKWALKYTAVASEGDPYYTLPFNYGTGEGFLRDNINGDYHYAVWDIYWEPAAGHTSTTISFRLNHAQQADGSVWTQRHITLETANTWTKVLFDMTGSTTAIGTPEVWSASGLGTAYADGETFNDSRIYFTTNVGGNDGDVYYLHEIAFFKTEAEAIAYMYPSITDGNGLYVEGEGPTADITLTDKAGQAIEFRSWSAHGVSPDSFYYTIDDGEAQLTGLSIDALTSGGWYDGIVAAVGAAFESTPAIYQYDITGLKVLSGEHTYSLYAKYGETSIKLCSYKITDTESSAPQTGDMTIAMVAVVAVIALAAIVVLKKRVNA